MNQIERDTGIAKPTISALVREIQAGIGLAVVRRQELPALPDPATIRGVTQATNEDGTRLYRANLKGWHSFRTTFITLALSAGMPMELVRRLTGHTTVEVVLNNYFRPGREQLRKAVQSAMPKMLTEGATGGGQEKTRDAQLREVVEAMTGKTLKADKARLLAILDGKA